MPSRIGYGSTSFWGVRVGAKRQKEGHMMSGCTKGKMQRCTAVLILNFIEERVDGFVL
jgi:hypothetical protein